MGSLMEDNTLRLERSRTERVSEILFDSASEHNHNLKAYRLH